MTTKQYSATDERVNGAETRLVNEPFHFTTLSHQLQTALTKVEKILPDSKDKNLKSQAQPLNYLKRRKHREMKKTVFGYELILDLSQCDLTVMGSKKKLTEYVDTLCKLIKMKKYGKVQLPYFGLEKPHTKGYSLLQFIETSSITGHFSEHWRKSYINIFSCKPYDHKLAAQFTKKFFGAQSMKARFLTR